MNDFVIYWSDLTKEAQERILSQCHLSFRLSLDRPAREYGDANEKTAILTSKRGNAATISSNSILSIASNRYPVAKNESAFNFADSVVDNKTETTVSIINADAKQKVELTETKHENYTKESEKQRKRGRHISAEEKRHAMEYIGEHSKVFGGTMTRIALEKELGISHETLNKWINQIAKELDQNV